MIPIYEGQGEGIGYSFDTFLKRFEEICAEHKTEGRAKAFAFILYDFYNEALRESLELKGGFAQLDCLTSHDLSVFYFNSSDRELLKRFNEIFFYAFEVDDSYSLPLVVFFDFASGDVKEVIIVQLYEKHLAFSFKELFDVFEKRLEHMKRPQLPIKKASKFWSVIKTAGGKVADKAFEVVLSKITERLTGGH